VRLECRGTVRACDPKILEPIVIGDAVDVVKDQRHPRTTPDLTLAAELAMPPLEPLFEQPGFEFSPLVV
jgi:hypothetical protein